MTQPHKCIVHQVRTQHQKLFPARTKKTNTTPQLYGTPSTQQYVQPKTISRQNQILTQQHNWKKGSSSPREAWEGSSSPREASVFVSPSVIPSVRAKREIQSKRVFYKKTSFYLHRKFSIFLRNNRDCKAVLSYNKHILASKLFLKNRETGQAFFRKSKCDCQCSHF